MSELNFYQRITNLQNELVAPKNNYNSFGKYKYRSAEDILEAVKPLNQKHNVFLYLTDEPVLVGEWHYVKATAKLIDIDDPNNQIEATAYARESANKKGQDDSQITGTASSYARKYALNGLYLIDDTKDADTDEYQNQNNNTQTYQTQGKPPNQPKQISSKQVGLIKSQVKKIAKAKDKTDEDIYQALNVKDVTQLTSQQASAAIKTLNKWVEQLPQGAAQ